MLETVRQSGSQHSGVTPYGRSLATRLANDALYRHLPDPAGLSLIMTDAHGAEAGALLYDGFGAVLTSTLPITLTGAMPDLPDAATGLALLGGGRWYDPAVGRPLQPNPAGAPPTAPQALNRYTAGSLGQPGVVEAEVSNPSRLVMAIAANTVTAGTGMGLSAYANNLQGHILIQANNRLLVRAGYQNWFNQLSVPGRGRSAQYVSALVQQVDSHTYRTTVGNGLINLDHLEAQTITKRWGVTYPKGQPFLATNDTRLKLLLRTKGGQFAAGFALNVALSYPDLANPWQDPFLNTEQRLVQNAVTITGAGVSAGAGVWVGSAAAAAGLGGPATFVVVAETGLVVWAGWEYVVRPTASWIAVNIRRPDPYQGYRNLQPIGAAP